MYFHVVRDVELKLEEGIDVDARGGIKNNTLLCEAACHGHQVRCITVSSVGHLLHLGFLRWSCCASH